jgi:hypothetical protein
LIPVFLLKNLDSLGEIVTGLRALKAITVCAFLILITTAWVFRFNIHGYNQTLDNLHAGFGDGAYIFIAIFSVASLVSMPILGVTGIIGMIASRRLGRSAFLFGFLCFALSAANLVRWKRYGGVPAGNSGVSPVTQHASQDPPRKRPGKTPQQ